MAAALLTRAALVYADDLQPPPTTQFPKMTVSDTEDEGYAVPRATSATKTDASVTQTPIAVQVVPQQTMQDQQATRLQEAVLTNVSSMAAAPNGLSDNTNFTIRGFNTGTNVYRDGLLLPYTMNIDPVNLDAIEIVKGSGAALYGRMGAGGLVDLITKQPLDAARYTVAEQFGSFGLTRTTADLTGPVDSGKTLLYRLTGDFTHADSFIDYENSRNIFVSPSITFRPSERFVINIQAEYQDVRNVDSDPNVPAIGNRPANIPTSTYLEDPGITTRYPDTSDNKLIGYRWIYSFDSNWNLTNRLVYYNSDQHVSNMYFSFVSTNGVGANALQYGGAGVQTFTTNLELTGKFELAGTVNSVLLGADHLHFRETFNGIYDYDAQNINIFDPQPSYGTTSLASALDPSNGFALISKQSWNGVYAQDLISAAGDRIHLLIGGRYDWATTGSGLAFGDPNAWADANSSYLSFREGGFSPRVGLSVQATPWATFYANSASSLSMSNASAGTDAAGNPLPPQRARQWEAGVKTELFEKRLYATAAYYDIRLDHVPVAIPGSPGEFYLTGQQASRGVEIDINGRVADGFDLIANYSHDLANVTRGYQPDPADPQDTAELPIVGKLLPAVPKDTGNLWAKYSGLSRWNFAGGLNWTGQQLGDQANSFAMPSKTLLRAMVSHEVYVAGKRLLLQLNVENLLNERYFYGSTAYSNRYSLTPGAPRSVIGSVRLEL